MILEDKGNITYYCDENEILQSFEIVEIDMSHYTGNIMEVHN